MNIYQNPCHSKVAVDGMWKPSATANDIAIAAAVVVATETQMLNGKYSKFQRHQTPLTGSTTTMTPPPPPLLPSPPPPFSLPPPATKTTTTTVVMATNLQKTTKTIITFIAAYFEDSNIHGLQYVVKDGLTTIEKCLWLTLFIISMVFCVQIGLQSVDRYYTKSTVVGLERDFYYWNTTMPSATVCPLQRLDVERYKNYSRLNNLDPNEAEELFNFLEKMANSTYSNVRDIPNNKTIDLLLDRLNIKPISYMELIYNLTGDFSLRTKEDLIDFGSKVRSTTGDNFIETRQILTEYGLCYLTNTMLSEKFSSKFMIWGEMPFTDIHDLEGTVQVKESSFFDSDVSFSFLGFGNSPIESYLHSAYEVMEVDHNLGYSDESLHVEVESVDIIAEEGFELDATIEQRKCRFQHESNLTHFAIYTRNLCLQECRMNLVFRICKCIPHFYPNRTPHPKPICDYHVLQECLVQHEDYFVKLYKIDSNGHRETEKCYCAQNCRDAIVNKRAKYELQKTNDLIGGNSVLFSIINLPTYRLKRQIIFSFTDLLVSIGGAAGFFLGFSVLCLVEVIYYFTFRLLFFAISKCWNEEI